jgi:hypothetical protein
MPEPLSRGLKNVANTSRKPTQSEKPGPLPQVALTLIEQTVGAGHARDSGSGICRACPLHT